MKTLDKFDVLYDDELSSIEGGRGTKLGNSFNYNQYGLYYSHGRWSIDPAYVAHIVSDGIGGNL